MNRFLYIVLLTIVFSLNSCDNCTSPAKIILLDGIRISAKDTLDYTSPQFFAPSFVIGDTQITKKGEGKCRHKELALGFDNAWISSKFHFSCNFTLIQQQDTFPAYSNLIGTPICDSRIVITSQSEINRETSHLILKNFNQIPRSKPYTFYLKGETNDNKTFKDSCTIFIR